MGVSGAVFHEVYDVVLRQMVAESYTEEFQRQYALSYIVRGPGDKWILCWEEKPSFVQELEAEQVKSEA